MHIEVARSCISSSVYHTRTCYPWLFCDTVSSADSGLCGVHSVLSVLSCALASCYVMVHGDSMSASHNAASQLRHDESRYVTVTICLMLSRWDGTVCASRDASRLCAMCPDVS